jgi:hypothetical protein
VAFATTLVTIGIFGASGFLHLCHFKTPCMSTGGTRRVSYSALMSAFASYGHNLAGAPGIAR